MAWANILGNIATAVNLYSYYEGKKAGRQLEASNRSQANRYLANSVNDRIREINFTNPEFLVGNTRFTLDIIGREAKLQPLSNRYSIENRFNIYLARNPYYRGNSYTGSPVFRERRETVDSTTEPAGRVNKPVNVRDLFEAEFDKLFPDG